MVLIHSSSRPDRLYQPTLANIPNVDNPIITVHVSYPGANAEVIENQITEPLEHEYQRIPGIRSLISQSSQGSSRITVEFELSRGYGVPPQTT
jgi:multidrug efflux pump subunit AcrB